VDPALLIKDSEYLDSHLVAVPNSLVKAFLKSYETISPMVVPRSSIKISSDDEFTLFIVTTFKKYSQEFIHKCRESKWTPRDFKFVENGQEEEKKETERVGRDEKKLWGEALRLGRTGWGESVMIWVHVLALRVFVETVLRYGLPLDFICGLIKVSVSKMGPCQCLIPYVDDSETLQEDQIYTRFDLLSPGWERSE
jgi:V-type H+-transporting ATPase subunit C